MDFTQGTIADFDQLQMDALKALRNSKIFFVATLNDEGEFGLIYCGSGGLADPFIGELAGQVTELLEQRF